MEQPKHPYQVSVCMATYNGQPHLKEQLDSILIQLTAADELVISDDHSTDGTWELLQQYAENDLRIRLFKNPQKGVINNFEFAIANSQKEIIFLSDQDDLWTEDKVAIVCDYFEKNPKIAVIVSDLMVVNDQKEVLIPSYQKMRNTKSGFWHNWLKSSYIGAAMAFRAEFKQTILPIPEKVPMHDMWIGLLADQKKQVLFIPECLVYYRRHENNVTELKSTSSRWQQLKWRLEILSLIIKHNF